MFDYVNFSTVCDCGAKLDNFQSKEGLREMELIEPDGIREFHSSCKCGRWIEYRRPDMPMHPGRATPLTEAEVLAMGFERHVTQERG